MATTAKVIFKKKKKKRSQARRKVQNKEAYAGPDDEDTSSLISDILSDQKARARSNGVASMRAKKATGDDSDSEDGEGEEYSEKTGGVVPQNKLAMLSSGFAQEEDDGTEKEDPRMLEYVARKMGDNKSEEVVTPRSKRANLYAFPESVKKARTDANLEGETHGTGGPVPFITGIAEVELPVEYKLKNIEATELAKQKYISNKNSKAKSKFDDMDSHGTGGNFSTNFKQHNRDYHKRRREQYLRNNPDAAKNPAYQGKGERWQTSSDDRIMQRYVKRSSKYANRKSAVSFA